MQSLKRGQREALPRPQESVTRTLASFLDGRVMRPPWTPRTGSLYRPVVPKCSKVSGNVSPLFYLFIFSSLPSHIALNSSHSGPESHIENGSDAARAHLHVRAYYSCRGQPRLPIIHVRHRHRGTHSFHAFPLEP